MKYAVIILGLLAASYANAQDHLKDFSLKRSLKQDGLHLQFMVLDADKKGVRNHQPDKFYYWTKAQHVRATQGASSGLLLHGPFEAFYPDKQLAQKGEYRKGLKHGTWKYWHEDGTFLRIEEWRNGVLSGKQQFFDENGSLVRTELVRHGERKKSIKSDSVIVWKAFDRKTIILKDSIGRISEVQNFKNGELHGIQKSYSEGNLENKQRFKKGAIVEKKSKEASETGNDEESGKLKQLWNKLFAKKDKSETKEKADKEKDKKRSKRTRKEKSAGEE